jgi:hypothetical protein
VLRFFSVRDDVQERANYARFGWGLTRGGDVGSATRVGPKVQTVLGLSMTSTSVGWVLLDGQGPDAATLDHDAFDVQSGAGGDTSQHAAAARGAQSIATASGHKVGSVQVTWTEDVEADGTALLKSLADLGFDNIHPISLSKAAQAWGIASGRENEYTKTGLCILEPEAASIMVVATGAGSVRTAVTDTRDTAEDLVEWLRTVFRRDGWLPESLYLVGALADLDKVTEPIAEALPIPVSDSVDTQLALARGAALAMVSGLDTSSPQAETPHDRPWRVPPAKKSTTPAAADTVVSPSVSETDTSQAAESRPVELPSDAPRHDRPWPVSNAKKLTISAAAVAVCGAALSLAAGSSLNVENASMQARNAAAQGASATSASVPIDPAPVSARQSPQVQPLAAVPPPAPPASPKPLPPPAEPDAAVAPEPVAVPAPQQTVSAPPVSAPPAVAPVAAPVTSPPVAVPAATAPPPVAHLGVPLSSSPQGAVPAPVAPGPVAPGPVAPPPAAPLAAEQAPVPAAPAPQTPAPQPPVDPPPPPDPFQAVLSPLFSGLP